MKPKLSFSFAFLCWHEARGQNKSSRLLQRVRILLAVQTDRLGPSQLLLHQQSRQPAHGCDCYSDTTEEYLWEKWVLCVRVNRHNHLTFPPTPVVPVASGDIQAQTRASAASFYQFLKEAMKENENKTIHTAKNTMNFQGFSEILKRYLRWHCAVAWVSGLKSSSSWKPGGDEPFDA